MAFAFEKLLVYQKAVDFADYVAVIMAGIPRASPNNCAEDQWPLTWETTFSLLSLPE